MKRPFDTRGLIGAGFLLFAGLFVVGAAHCGCAKRGTVEDAARRGANAMTVEDYRAALAECHKDGVDAGSQAVYFRCASEANKHFGVKP